MTDMKRSLNLNPNCESWRAEILRECSPPTTCHVSGVMCHMSNVTYQLSRVTYGRTCRDGYLAKKFGIFALMYVHIVDYSTTLEVF